jgi:hypothetical protein
MVGSLSAVRNTEIYSKVMFEVNVMSGEGEPCGRIACGPSPGVDPEFCGKRGYPGACH